MRKNKIAPAYVAAIRSLRQRVEEAAQAHDMFVTEVLLKIGLDPSRNYHVDDAGVITELPTKKEKP